MPIFGRGLDTVTVDGREWAQIDLFTNLSWNDINAVCPAGACTGVLNGYDMTGWTWASAEAVSVLFNHYIGRVELGAGPNGEGIDIDCAVVDAFSNDGWRPTRSDATMGEMNWYGLAASNATIQLDVPATYIATIYKYHNLLETPGWVCQRHFPVDYNPDWKRTKGGWFWRPR